MAEIDHHSRLRDQLEEEKKHGLEKATQTLDAIESHVHEVNPDATLDEVDAAVADFVDHTDKPGVDPDERLLGVATGALEVLADPSAHNTALEIGQAPVDTLGVVLGELTPEQASVVIGVVDQAEHDLPNHEAAITMTKSTEQLAIDHDLTGEVVINSGKNVQVGWVEERGASHEAILSPFGPGTNPETGNFDVRFMPRSEDIEQNLIHDKLRSGAQLPVMESIRSGRDKVTEHLGEVEFLPDRVYRATDINELQALVNEGKLRSLTENDDGTNNNKGVDWYLGGTSTRYGDVFLETAARPDYVGPKVDNGTHLASGGYVRHFHSSGDKHPIPIHEISVIAQDREGRYVRMKPQDLLQQQNSEASDNENDPTINNLDSSSQPTPIGSSETPVAMPEAVQTIPISPSEQAAQYLERIGGTATPEAIQAVVSRIEAEKDKDGPAKIGPNYAQRVLETTGDDQDAKLYQVESFARADINGSEVLHYETVSTLLMNINQETIVGKLAKEKSPELMHLADIQSELPIDFFDASIVAHERALRVIVETTGVPVTEWIKRVNDGSADDLPDAAQRYAAMPETPRLALLEVVNRNTDGLLRSLRDESLPIAERRKEQQGFRETFPAVLEVLMQEPEAKRLGESFLRGDVHRYGFDHQYDPETGKASSVLNERGYQTCVNYMENVASLGADEVVALNRDLGIVNFGSYTHDTLQSMRDIISNPGDHSEISIIVRGNDGDHNGAINSLVSGHNLRDTLIFEVNTQQGLERTEAMVASLGVNINKVTIAGHGGASGLHVSSRLEIGRDKDELARNSPLLAIINRITPDQSGVKNVFLASCSQGRRYDRKGSMAEALASVADDDLVVEAAPRVAYIDNNSEHGAKVVRTNPYHETARSLGKFQRLPGVKSLVEYLDSIDRQRNGTVRVTKKSTTRNPSGIVNIGE